MTFHTIMAAFLRPEVDYDVIANINHEDVQKAQQRRNARKQRARELTKLRELELKKGKVK